MRDEDVRMSCLLSLDVLRARLGDDIPYRNGLDQGFPFRGERVPFLAPAKGIFRARVQRGPAALSVNTSANSPYDDVETDEGFLYAYRAGAIEQPDNRALRAAHDLQVPIVYFVGTRPGWYRPLYPFYIEADDPVARRVLLTAGAMRGPMDDPEPAQIVNEVERRHVVRETRVRLDQARFRGLVLPAYGDRCAICRLREVRLLDAAHIIEDVQPRGAASIPNGVSLCTIHHRAFDQDLVGVSPDYEVRVAPRLLEDDDGPMLEVLKTFHESSLHVPQRHALRPDREQLAVRFDRFLAT